MHLVVGDLFDPGDRDQVVLEARAQVELGQLDVGTHHLIDLADVAAIGTDHFHMLADFGGLDHRLVSIAFSWAWVTGKGVGSCAVSDPINLTRPAKSGPRPPPRRARPPGSRCSWWRVRCSAGGARRPVARL